MPRLASQALIGGMRKTVIGIGLAIFLEIMRIAKDCYSTQISDSIARPMIAIDNVCKCML